MCSLDTQHKSNLLCLVRRPPVQPLHNQCGSTVYSFCTRPIASNFAVVNVRVRIVNKHSSLRRLNGPLMSVFTKKLKTPLSRTNRPHFRLGKSKNLIFTFTFTQLPTRNIHATRICSTCL